MSESKTKNTTNLGWKPKLSPYQNPTNADEIVENVKNCETHDEIVNLINKVFPTWIIGWPKRFCADYPHFENNWKYICKQSNCKPLSVIIVDKIEFNDTKYSTIKLFCELLTVFGHSVRRKEEFIGCVICGDAIPSQYVYNQLVERKIPVPNSWMVKCRHC